MEHGNHEGDIWVVISNETAKLVSCNSSGKTVYWNTQKEASQYAASLLHNGWEVQFHMYAGNLNKLIHADDVRTISKYG
jgi:hypothetical protein